MYVVADKQPGCVEEAGQQYIQKLSGGALSFNGTKENNTTYTLSCSYLKQILLPFHVNFVIIRL